MSDNENKAGCSESCKECHSFSNPQGNTIYECQDKVNSNTTLIIVSVVLSCVFVIIIIIVVFICVKNYRKKMYLPKQSSKYLGKFKVYRDLKIKNFPINNNDDSLSNSNEQIGNFEQTEQTNNNNTNKRNYRKRLNMDSVIPIKRVKFQSNFPVQMNMIKKKNHKLHNTVSPHKKKFEFKKKSKNNNSLSISNIIDNTMKMTDRDKK